MEPAPERDPGQPPDPVLPRSERLFRAQRIRLLSAVHYGVVRTGGEVYQRLIFHLRSASVLAS